MEIKYEAVFGDQSLFDGMMDDCEFASEEYGYSFANGRLCYCERYNEKAGWSLSFKSRLTFKPSAMRRIIRTPTWTVADQKAGKLPEVGAKYTAGDFELACIFVDSLGDVWGSSGSGRVKCHAPEDIRPIETPEEKAGKLPEVGCRVNFCHKLNTNWRTGEIKYIDDQVVVIKVDDVARPFAYEVDRVEFKPIESPEEKAKRLREEWCESALKIINHKFIDARGPIAIYDALLSGDLPVPVKE